MLMQNVPPLKRDFKGFSRGPLDPDLQLLKLKEFIINGKVQSQGATEHFVLQGAWLNCLLSSVIMSV